MIFKYIASLAGGGKEKSIITAENITEAEALLRERQRTIISIEEVESSSCQSTDYHLEERSNTEKKMCRLFTKSLQIELALEQLALMLESGVPILNAFRTIAMQSPYYLGRAFFCIANKLQTGKGIIDTLKSEMPFLGTTIIGMLAAGEANGDLDKMCKFSAELLERKRKLRGQVIQALAYPLVVIVITVCVVVFLMFWVIPKIMKFLSSSGKGLPSITQLLIDISNFLFSYGIWLAIVPIISITAIVLMRKTPEIAIHIDNYFLKMPIIGNVISLSCNMLWCRTMGILLRSGINILPALDFTIESLNNYFYRNELNDIKELISQGHPFSTAFRVSKLSKLAPLAENMIIVGENTGKMDSGLLKVAEFSDVALERKIALLSKLVEPAMFIIVGGIVGFVYIAFFLGMMATLAKK